MITREVFSFIIRNCDPITLHTKDGKITIAGICDVATYPNGDYIVSNNNTQIEFCFYGMGRIDLLGSHLSLYTHDSLPPT